MRDEGLRLERRDEGGRSVLEVTGELDATTVGRFDRSIEDALDSSPTALLLDLRGVSFIDSMGLRSVVQAASRASASSLPLRICPSPPVHRVLELTGLLDVLPLHDGGARGGT